MIYKTNYIMRRKLKMDQSQGAGTSRDEDIRSEKGELQKQKELEMEDSDSGVMDHWMSRMRNEAKVKGLIWGRKEPVEQEDVEMADRDGKSRGNITEDRMGGSEMRDEKDDNDKKGVKACEPDPAYKMIQCTRREINSLRRIGTDSKNDMYRQDLLNEEDMRLKDCAISYMHKEKFNVTYSFDPQNLRCGCNGGTGHSVVYNEGVTGQDRGPVVLYATDQVFSPTTSRTGCRGVLRVEDGSLMDIFRVFRTTFRGHMIPTGSVVHLVSLGHLWRVGTAAYCEDFVEVLNVFEKEYRGDVRIVHGVPMCQQEMKRTDVVRQLVEVMQWILEVDRKGRHCLPDLYTTYIEKVLKTGQERTKDEPVALRLPSSLRRGAGPQGMLVGQGKGETCDFIPKFSAENEDWVLNEIEREVQARFGLRAPNSSGSRTNLSYKETTKSKLSPTFVVFGSSHAAAIASNLQGMGLDVRDLSDRTWRLDTGAGDAAEDLRRVLSDVDKDNTVVILQLYDNSTYKGAVVREGELSYHKPFKQDGRFHILGEVNLAGVEVVKDMVSESLPILRALGNTPVIVVTPMMRYMTNTCCVERTHCTNFYKEDYVDTIQRGLSAINRQIRGLLHNKGFKNVRTASVNGFWKKGERGQGELWGDDPVHPTQTAYRLIAEGLAEKGEEMLRTRLEEKERSRTFEDTRCGASSSGSDGRSGSKRVRQDSDSESVVHIETKRVDRSYQVSNSDRQDSMGNAVWSRRGRGWSPRGGGGAPRSFPPRGGINRW